MEFWDFICFNFLFVWRVWKALKSWSCIPRRELLHGKLMLHFYQASWVSITKGREQNLSRWKCEPLKLSDLRAVDSKVLVGVVCSLYVQMCWCTAVGPTTVCNLLLGGSISLSGLLAQSAFALNSHLWGFLTTTIAWIPGIELHSRWERESDGELGYSLAVFWKISQCQCPDSSS